MVKISTQNAINNVEIAETLIDAKGDIVVGTNNDTAGRLAIGADTYLLAVRTDTPAWIDPASISIDAIAETLIDAKGDLIVGSADDTAARLAIGADGAMLFVSTDTPGWTTSTWPNTVTSGHILYASGANTIAGGTAATIGLMELAIMAAKGDLISASANDTPLILSVGTNGQVLTAASGEATGLVWASLTDQLAWSVVTEDTAGAVNNGYITNDAVDLCTISLPATAAVGDRIKIIGMHANGWAISISAGDTVYFGTISAAGAGGSLASSATRDSIELVCTVADTDWVVVSAVGNITYVAS